MNIENRKRVDKLQTKMLEWIEEEWSDMSYENTKRVAETIYLLEKAKRANLEDDELKIS